MKEPKRRQSLSGAVLIMVLTVMTVLIILLMATLTVVSSANQRIYTKYEENQAYYTARSALDVFVGSMLTDKEFALSDTGAKMQYVYVDPASATGDAKKSTAGMKQGLALQLDIYNTESKDKTYGLLANAYTSDGVFNTETNYRDFAVIAGQDKLTYLVKLPSSTDTASKGNRMSDKTDILEIGTTDVHYDDVIIEIEVLNREYNLGGTDADFFNQLFAADPAQFEVDATTGAYPTSFTNGPDTRNDSDLKNAIKLGDRSKDHIELKITATATLKGITEKAVLLFDSSDPPVPNGTRAVTATGNATDIDNMVVVGGVSVADTSRVGNTGGTVGNTFIEGNLYNDGGGSTYELVDNETLYIDGKLQWQNTIKFINKGNSGNHTDRASLCDRPCVYINNNPSIPLNDGSVTLDSNNKGIYGTTNGLTDDVNGPVDLILRGGTGNALMAFSGDGTFTYHGNIYIDGDVDFSPCGSHNPIIDGTLYVSGTITYKVDGGTTYTPVTSSGSPTVVKTLADFPTGFNWADQDTSTPDILDIKLPDGVEKSIPLKGNMYDEHYRVDASLDDDDGDGNKYDDEEMYTAEDLFFLTKDERLLLNDSNRHTSDTFDAFLASIPADHRLTATSSAGTRVYTDSGTTMTADATTNELKMITTAGDYYFTKDSTSFSPKLVIGGGGVVNLVLDPNGTYNATIIVEDDTTLRIVCPSSTGSGEYNFQNTIIANRSFYNKIYSSPAQSVYVGQRGAGLVAPTISLFTSAGYSIKCDGNVLFTGYIQCPKSKVSVYKGIGMKLVYNDTDIGNKDITILGSLLCGQLDASQAVGIAYINPSVVSVPEGDPLLSFGSVQYSRN